jgi:hypothetical protein
MGRVEVWNPRIERPGAPNNGAWGTVCGHYFWDNDNMANTVCRQLGFSSGSTYTFGASKALPSLPIVTGYRTCQGGEYDLFQCDPSAAKVADPDCGNGCLGADGEQGTGDDSIDPTCIHSIDQGAIRARSHCRFVPPLIHFAPDSLT